MRPEVRARTLTRWTMSARKVEMRTASWKTGSDTDKLPSLAQREAHGGQESNGKKGTRELTR